MPLFEITYEDVGFTSDKTSDCVLNEHFMEGFSEKKLEMNSFPKNMLALKEAYITEDDHQENNAEKKVFASISFIVEAATAEEAESAPIPVELLNDIADLVMQEGEDDISIDFEGNWEVLSTYDSDFVPKVPTVRAVAAAGPRP